MSEINAERQIFLFQILHSYIIYFTKKTDELWIHEHNFWNEISANKVTYN